MLYYVRALYDFEAGTSDELPCPEGAILAVVEDIFEEWYEAEYEGLRGMVPKTYCEVIKDPSKLPAVPKLNQIVVVMYNYEGQDSDELRVQEGDVLQILDDSDSDWYVAKPVSKAGRPGLIPKSFCQPPEDSQPSPTESRGKKAQETMERKEEEKRREDERRRREEESRMEKISTMGKSDTLGYANDSVERAKVTAYEKRGAKYWYVVEVQSAAGKKNIYRTYQDFYDFHTKLMDAFPDEAGDGDVERIIPFLPGQRLFVNENVAKQRRTDLDVYCSELLRLPPRIVRSKMLVNFFATRPSDETAQAQGSRGGNNGGSKNQEPSPALPARRPDQSNKSGLPPAPWSLDGARSRSASNSNLSQAAQKPDRPFSVAPRATNSPVARAKSIARSSVARNGPVQGGGGGYSGPGRGGYVSGLAVGKPLKVVPTAGAAGFASNSFSSSATGAPIPNPKPYATPTPAYSAPKAFSPAPTYAAPRAFGSSTPSSDPYRASPMTKPSSASLPKPQSSQRAGAPPLATKPSFGKVATQSFPPPPSSSSFSNPSGATVVVKVHHKQEIISFMVSPDTAYAQLKDTAFKKLGIPPKPLQFKDEDGDLVTINGDDDLFMAFQANPTKIFLYVP